MPALFLALLTCALAMAGGRSALQAARFAAAFGASGALLAVCWLSAIAASALAGWAGTWLAPALPSPAVRAMLVAAALALGGLELLFVTARAGPAEPTRSLGALILVLFAQQATDAARFVIVALAVWTAAPALAAAGGALGSGAVLSAAWALGGEWDTLIPVVKVRRVVGGLFFLAAVIAALAARGLIG